MTSTTSVAHHPTIADVQRIVAMPDPVLRNLQITQCYHELSAVLAARTGPSANWCTFATWASKQAGQTIRQEDLPRALESLVHTGPAATRAMEAVIADLHRVGVTRPHGEIQTLVWEIVNPLSALDRAATAVARGNLKVFEEIAHQFARFLEMCLPDPAFEAGNLRRFCESLRPGDPPQGQRYLAQAFTHYYQAFFEPDPKQKAELLLMANIEIGFHEQTRLQPEIAAALDAPVMDPREVTRRLLANLFKDRSWFSRVQWFLRQLFRRPSPLDAAVNKLTDTLRQQVRQAVTDCLMTLTLHDVRLRLGQDLDAQFPPFLHQITNSELRALLNRLDPTSDSLQETAAVDWANLSERLHFIIDLFRCYQEWPDVFEPPFSPDTVSALKAGRLPFGPL